ncbi:MAG: CCA tRNA nucleotidyltransferase [Alphaproteobacteria bacterium]|nr:CCA tRNA nucleotidyltransferase [Alphaproteobacteria bacterium]
MVLDEKQKAKILTPSVRTLMSALKQGSEETARVVGGAVRDVLMGRTVLDIDIATTHPPERTMDLLRAANIKTVPTGLAHGTVTAVVGGAGYEITTLRRDVETDGRHATVAFTGDWKEDAARRDFTINALYVDAQGTLYDFFGGIDDAKAGRVRFIGDARTRIREDVLRILRYFRFYAALGTPPPDAEALSACRDLAPLIPTLSAERIARELTKLLGSKDPAPALRLMESCGVLNQVLPETKNFERLDALLQTEKKRSAPPAFVVRFASLLPEDETTARNVASRLKLSNKDTNALAVLAELPAAVRTNHTPEALRRMAYGFGVPACLAAALLAGDEAAEAMSVLEGWTPPVFPIKGEDLLKLGMPAGPKIGEILREIEERWIGSGFSMRRDACLAGARALWESQRGEE